MIWATVSSQSCFCWLYRASPSLASKNIINLISVLTIWWCSYVESSLALLEESVYYDQCILLAKFCKPLPCFILHFKAKLSCYSRYLLTSYICISIPMVKKTSFSVVSSRRSCRLSKNQKVFPSDQHKEIDKNNRIGKTRDRFKKIKRYQGNVSFNDRHNKGQK